MTQDRIYAYAINTGDYVYRIPGHMHGDGSIDTDESPVWLLCDEAECDGDVPNVYIDLP